MAEEALPAALVAFVRRAVSSIWALELLLSLKANRASAWSVAQLVRELRSSGPLVLDILISLHRSGLLEKAGEGYRYAPASDELGECVEQLERLSAERPLAVRNAILAAPHDRIQVFADGFKIRRD